MMQRVAKIKIEPPWDDCPVIDMLSQRFTYHTRREWYTLLNDGRITINDSVAAPDQVVHRGDILEYHVPPVIEPPVAGDYRVVWQRPGLLAVDKPANLPCHPAGRFFNHTLWAFLKRDLGLDTLHFISRLDRETSGLVLIATDQEAAETCRRQAAAGQIRKEYYALVEGDFGTELYAQGWLCRDHSSVVRKKRQFVPQESDPGPPPCAQAVWAETALEPVDQTAELSLVKARLVTGRTHQIRATLCSLGYPLVGDKIYGVDDTVFLRFIRNAMTEKDRQRLRIGRQALHAIRLTFKLPENGSFVELEAPLPADLQELL